jgi:hypothetical protein
MNIYYDKAQYLDLLVYLTEEQGVSMAAALEICQLRQQLGQKVK